MTLLHQAAQKAVEAALHRAFSLGQTYWQQTNSEAYSRDKFTALVAEMLSALQQQEVPSGVVIPPAPPECETEDEKTAFAFGYWQGLHAARKGQEVPREPVAWRYRLKARDDYPAGPWYVSDRELEMTPGQEIEPLYASPSTTQQQEAGNGWRPIETVPNDGREIILLEGSRVGAACWVKWPDSFYTDGTPKDDGGEGWTVGYDGDEWRNPTAWQPMPAAPSTPEGAEKDDAGGGKEQ